MDDPWLWGVDRVVQELCTSDRSWQPRTESRPDPATLENNLREQEVNGSVLLLDVDDNILRTEFSIKALGQRAFIRGAIDELRLKSAQYQSHIQKQLRYGLASHHSSSIGGFSQYFPQPGFDPLQFGFPQYSLPAISPSTRIGPGSPADTASPQLPEGQEPITPAENRATNGEFVFTGSSGTKRRRLDLEIPVGNLPLPSGDHPPLEVAPSDQIGFEQNPVSNLITNPAPEADGKKRKRIAPTLITSVIDPNRNREIPNQAVRLVPEGLKSNHENANEVDFDGSNQGGESEVHPLEESVTVEPGVPYVDKNNKKRLVPIRQPDSDDEAPYDYGELLRKSRLQEEQALYEDRERGLTAAENLLQKVVQKRTERSINALATGYLGKQKIPVDNIFYDGILVGQEMSPAEDVAEFSHGGRNISSGRRLYVHRVMKNFLRSERQVISREGKQHSAVRPYPVKLTPRHHNPSFTLFSSDPDGKIHARREELSSWPEIDPEAPLPQPRNYDDQQVNFKPAMWGNFEPFQDRFDPDVLERYQHIEGGDEVLPIYGESDEDNEFDLETWAEIEEERGTLEGTEPKQNSKKRHLTLEEIDHAIDESIAEIIIKWNKEKLPKKQRRAFKLWKATRLRKNRQAHLQEIRDNLSRMNNDRIPKLRKEIATEVWTSPLSVKKQARSMEQSIFDREGWLWEKSIIESKIRPEKPAPRPPASKKSTSETGEEGESVGSDIELYSSDEDMDEFIVDDHSSEEIELSLADSEGEDETAASDTSIFNDTPRSDTGRKNINFRVKYSASDQEEAMSDSAQTFRSVDRTPQHSSAPVTPFKKSPPKEDPKFAGFPSALSDRTNDVVDLTMLSSDDTADDNVVDLRTPPNKRTAIRLFTRNTPFKSPRAISISDSDEIKTTNSPDPNNLPPLDNPVEISRYNYQAWTNIGDRERLLIQALYWKPELHVRIFSFISNISEVDLWSNMSNVVEAAIAKEDSVKGMDNETFATLLLYLWLFEIYVYCKFVPKVKPSKKGLETLQEKHDEWFSSFYALARKFEECFKGCSNKDDSGDEGPQSAVKRVRAISTSDEEDPEQANQDTPRKLRKNPIFEDANARNLREREHKRKEDLERRRAKLQSRLKMSGDSQYEIIINDGKYDEQGFIYVNQHIAHDIKPHQIDGVRFMWTQIVSDENEMQGCLLAHTMGLGKTMQVITLLVAIAEASASTDETVYSQIPQSLRASKTLILCPPGLINNWEEELLLWAPKDILGDLRKVNSTKARERLREIERWYHDGGVLILSYEMFRMYIENKKTKTRDPPLSETEHEKVKQQLLEGPNIIVADEAHKMKNANSAITKCAVQFKSKSRIALTGTPLANNVEEYHTMIEWLAPNYLGPAIEFRAKYVEPIQNGLYQDSTAAERRKSLKMLGVLKEDLSPKVHRADISVLRNDLPPKKEFVITVPLTDLQAKAYSIYVKSMMAGKAYNTTKTGEVTHATVWHWLAILSLLCNHPECFNAKLNQRKEDATKEVSGNGTDQDIDLDAPVWKVGVSQELIDEITTLFKAEASDLKSIHLSNKVKILSQILDACRVVKEKVLIFSHSIATLDYLEALCKRQGRKYVRLDGKTEMRSRQGMVRDFNNGDMEVALVSTRAGGVGLNMVGANRVIIFDFNWNPVHEEQAVGRAYRITQERAVFVYRFVAGGTFEDSVHNKAIFKTQLASRVVDKKNPIAWAKKSIADFLFEPKRVEQSDLSEFDGMDPLVLDEILKGQAESDSIRAIVQTDTFERDDDDKLTAEEQKEVDELLSDKKLERSDPAAYYALLQKRQAQFLRQTMPAPSQPGQHLAPADTHRQTHATTPTGTSAMSKSSNVRPVAPSTHINEDPRPVLGNANRHSIAAGNGAAARTVVPTPVKTSDRPVNGSPNARGRSPIAGTSMKIRRSTPDGRKSTAVQKEDPRRSKSITAEAEALTRTPSTNKPPSTVVAGDSTKKVRSSKMIRLCIYKALIEANKRTHVPSPDLDKEYYATASKFSVDITAALTKLAGPDSKEVARATRIATNILEASTDKCRALLNGRMTSDVFALSVVKSMASQSSTSSMASNDPPPRLLSNPSSVFPHHDAKPKVPLGDLSTSQSNKAEHTSLKKVLPPNFRLWFDRELVEYLITHLLSISGTREEMIARCEARCSTLANLAATREASMTQPEIGDSAAKSDMFEAMARKPGPRPLREPVTGKKPLPFKESDEMYMKRLKRRREAAKSSSSTSPSKGGTSPPSKRIPVRAESEIRKSQDGAKRNSRGTSSVTLSGKD